MKEKSGTRIRHRVLAFVGALIVLSLAASTVSLFQISHVNRTLDEINRISMPVSKLFAQMQIDAEVFRREIQRGLGSIHWNDSHWVPRPPPPWITEVLDNEIGRTRALLENASLGKREWKVWAEELSNSFTALKNDAANLYVALEKKDRDQAAQIYAHYTESLEQWSRKLQWGVNEYETVLRESFTEAQSQVAQLRTGLEMILLVVVCLSLLLLWLGERALRPLSDLTRLAREITRRGLKREDKISLPEVSLHRDDEVSQLAREFHRMATQLLERESVVERQNASLEEQYELLKEMGRLNETVLNSMRSILIVTDLSGRITRANPVAIRWLGAGAEKVVGSSIADWTKLLDALGGAIGPEERKIDPQTVEGRIYGGQIFSLKQSSSGKNQGSVIVLEDLTSDVEMEERLRRAENLAAVGRLSAQVAHEVRNPLHSIGLEAELAIEQASKLSAQAQAALPPGSVSNLKSSLQSILQSVDRLENITENYLKLSRLSSGSRARVDLSVVLESVLATYASLCEKYAVTVDWKIEANARLEVFVDQAMFEQALGNLLQNSIQAMENAGAALGRRVHFKLGHTERGSIYLRVEDEGPGVPEGLLSKLFTPFMTTKAQGTGLGLSFVKKVVEDHQGEIRYVVRPGKRGACFEITLPDAGLSSEAESEPLTVARAPERTLE